MDIIEICKVLSNEKRLQILDYLKEPEKHFSPRESGEADFESGGVSVTQIQEKLHVTQSTASQYLTALHRVGLLKARRIGKWTYYRRDEEMIQKACESIEQTMKR